LFPTRASSIRANRREKALHLCKARLSPSTSSRPHETFLIRGELLLGSIIGHRNRMRIGKRPQAIA
jgi:hypothetical protein